jgi:acyl transferase domain-containing protein
MEIFEIELNLLDYDVVKDHVISGLTILPAAAYMELVLANFEHFTTECGVTLRRIKFSTPMIFQNSSTKKVHITFEDAGSFYKFQVLSLNEEGSWIGHVEGQAEGAVENIPPEEIPQEAIPPDNLINTSLYDGRYLGKEDIYEMYKEAGLSYGPSFRCIENLWLHEKEVYAKLGLPSDRTDKNNAYLLHPAVLDSAFQAAGLPAFYEQGDRIYLPYYVEELIYRKPFEAISVCHSKQRDMNIGQSPVKRYDITLYDTKGNGCVFIKGLTLKSLDKPVHSSRKENEPQIVSYSKESPKYAEVNPQTIDSSYKSEVADKVIEVLSEVLHIDKSEFDSRAVFGDYGVDSIIVEELLGKLNGEFDTMLDATILFDYPTIDALSEYLAGIASKSIKTPEVKERELSQFTTPASNEAEGAVKELELTSNEMKNELARRETERGDGAYEIAVIGLSGRFPETEDEEGFWDFISEGKSAITEIPKSRWNNDIFYSEDPEAPGKTDCKYGSFLHGIDEFDPTFFGISVNKAPMMDPQQRLMLEVAWKAVEDAGYSNGSLAKTRTGVYIGICNNEYVHLGEKDYEKLTPHVAAGNAFSIVANRISYILDVNGPSMAIDSACSSSMVALHNGCKDIIAGECEMALVGGVNLTLAPENHIIFSKAKVLSTDGKVRSFDEQANGYIRGEGAGAILLKPLAKALEDGDNIHAVIKSTSIMHAGKSNGLNTPNPASQKKAIQEAYTKSGIAVESISYIETHGSGTELGDYSEFRAMSDAFKQMTNKKQFCAIATVKANIGHAESAAGVLAIIKVILSLQKRKLPPLINFERKNKKIDMVNSPFYVNGKLSDWIPNGEIRRAGINCFGFGGTYAHVILEEYNDKSVDSRKEDDKGYLLTLSSQSKETLLEMSVHLREYIDKKGAEINISDLCYTLASRREHYNYRIAVEGETLGELKEKLKDLAEKGVHSREICYGGKENKRPKQILAFDESTSGIKDILSFYNSFFLYQKIFKEVVYQLPDDYKETIQKYVKNQTLNSTISEEEEWVLSIIHNDAIYQSLKQIGVKVNGLYGVGEIGVVSSLLIAGAINYKDIKLIYRDKLTSINLNISTNELLKWSVQGIDISASEQISIYELIVCWCVVALAGLIQKQPKLNLIKSEALTNLKGFKRAAAECYVKGMNLNWTSYYMGEQHKTVSAPGYVFSHKTYWHV